MQWIDATVTLATITPDNEHKVHSYIQRVNGYPVFNEYKQRIGKVRMIYVEKDKIKGILELRIDAADKMQVAGIVARAMQAMALSFKL